MRRSISDHMAALENRGERLAMPAGMQPSPVHVQAVQVMSELMTLGQQLSGPDTPTHLKVLMRTVEKGKPMLLEGLASVPPEKIQEFFRDLSARIQLIIDAPIGN